MLLKSTIAIAASLFSLVAVGGVSPVIGPLATGAAALSAVAVNPRWQRPQISAQTAQAVSREVLSCTITMAKVDTPRPPLSVYLAADDPHSQVVGQLANEAFVAVSLEHQGWFLIQQPIEGWIPKQLTQSSCNQKVELVKFGAAGGITAIADRFVGTGSHLYRLPLTAGATLTITTTRGGLPFVISPDQALLGVPEESQITWVGKVAQTGVYTLEMLSHYQGYRYAFTVSVH
jgi:hypothetical protein